MGKKTRERDAGTIRIHRMAGREIEIEPAPVRRGWMDASPDRSAYRCQPLNIANSHGWQVLCPSEFRVRLTGSAGALELEFEYEDPRNPPAVSHFGLGVVTFFIPALITTPAGVSLYVTGPANAPRHGITPLSGVVETDWLPFTFTMNWRMTTTNHWVTFRKGDPFTMFFPVRLADIERYEVEISDLDDSPELKANFEAYSRDRAAFLKDFEARAPEDQLGRWQRTYIKGGLDGISKGVTYSALNLSRPKQPSDD
ncbi:DUF6065 family protein [Maritimibacter sp. UBA3975]|uniref:DUF6065 family protein n=1 Tax=Maritimibacter sp. UBA3975 TaxID=1946833 RepID=UPI000C08E99F|nr:DUF6065 family protein [Maritimibacter sp. UBA3975]MAM60292.1 hypothetical protein [Maritimibacter sp.]|tara:strand:- start:255 stop:1019 length:765 start_codon:yes stop_codon:yes gene_type:complete